MKNETFDKAIETLKSIQNKHSELEIIVCGSAALAANKYDLARDVGDLDIVIRVNDGRKKTCMHPIQVIDFLEKELGELGLHGDKDSHQNVIYFDNDLEVHAIMPVHAFFSETLIPYNGIRLQAPLDAAASKMIAVADLHDISLSKSRKQAVKHAGDLVQITLDERINLGAIVANILTYQPDATKVIQRFIGKSLDDKTPSEVREVQSRVSTRRAIIDDAADILSKFSNTGLARSRIKNLIHRHEVDGNSI